MGFGKRESDRQVMRVRNISGRNEMVVENQQDPVGESEPVALAMSRAIFQIGAVGGLVVLRLSAATLLALGPLFVVFLLFDATRGWFAGWLRGLAATMIGMVGVGIVLGVELALLEPWVAGLLARRAGEETIAGAPVELMAATAIFGLASLGAIAMAIRVAGGFRFPEAWRTIPERVSGEFERIVRGRDGAPGTAGEAAAERSRAAVVADAVLATQRREMAIGAAMAGAGQIAVAPDRMISTPSAARDLPVHTTPPLGQSHGRRTRNRVSASAGRRDTR
jgi:type IV secretion system protein VirB6